MMNAPRIAILSALVVACSSQRTGNGSAASSAGATASATSPVAPPDATAGAEDAGRQAAGEEPDSREPSFDEVAAVLFADRASPSSVVASCPSSVPAQARLRCLFDERYRGDAKAAMVAHELLVRWQVVAGVEVAHTMDGGYRGHIRIEPALPVGAERRHIEWIAGAMRDFDRFFVQVDRRAPDGPRAERKRYRFRPITLRFMRSVAARTPSAYAHDWTVAWNLAGSLHTSADAARETLFHEIFHLNDEAHATAGKAWSFGALGAIFDAIVRKCGTATACLAPYTPNDTKVRGGTYYSFQPGNGVREYAAELALRYYREQRAAFAAGAVLKPFKCGPAENARAWALMRDEFFAGVDAVPACGS
jgi:hypothetical protein